MNPTIAPAGEGADRTTRASASLREHRPLPTFTEPFRSQLARAFRPASPPNPLTAFEPSGPDGVEDADRDSASRRRDRALSRARETRSEAPLGTPEADGTDSGACVSPDITAVLAWVGTLPMGRAWMTASVSGACKGAEAPPSGDAGGGGCTTGEGSRPGTGECGGPPAGATAEAIATADGAGRLATPVRRAGESVHGTGAEGGSETAEADPDSDSAGASTDASAAGSGIPTGLQGGAGHTSGHANGGDRQDSQRDGGGEAGEAELAGAAGTPSAEFILKMDRADAMTENAGAPGQFLPGAPGGVDDASENGEGSEKVGVAGVDRVTAESMAATLRPGWQGAGSAEWTEAAGEVGVRPGSVDEVEATERIAELMRSAVSRIRETEAGEYRVELRPDRDTELVLRIITRDGGTEVEAELRRGDAAAFAGRWQDLQERLAEQGVKLAAWRTDGDTAGLSEGTAGDSWARRQPRFGDAGDSVAPTPRGSRAAVGPASTVGDGAGARIRGGQGWETWA